MSTNLIQKIGKTTKRGLIAIATAGALALSACGKDTGDGNNNGGSGGNPDVITCYGATTETDNSGLVFAWQEEGTYGVNNLFVHELAATCESADYCFKPGSNGERPVKNHVMRHGEYIPASTWKAQRAFIGDGNDPRQFTQEDPFIIGYLPNIAKSSWGWSNDNAEYDWSCQDSQCDDPQGYNYNMNHSCDATNGLENCLGLNQLDRTFSTHTLQHGKNYLVRFLFGSAVNDSNWIEFCNQTVLKY